MWSVHPGASQRRIKLSLVKKFPPATGGSWTVCIYLGSLSKGLVGAFLERAANIPLRLNLRISVYPSGISPTCNTHLLISHLHITSLVADSPSIGFYQSMTRASAGILMGLRVVADGNVTANLVTQSGLYRM